MQSNLLAEPSCLNDISHHCNYMNYFYFLEILEMIACKKISYWTKRCLIWNVNSQFERREKVLKIEFFVNIFRWTKNGRKNKLSLLNFFSLWEWLWKNGWNIRDKFIEELKKVMSSFTTWSTNYLFEFLNYYVGWR